MCIRDSVYTTYEGENGVELSLIKRIFYAIKEQNIRILVSTNINSDSKILYERNILDRASKLAPFFHYDSDPYNVVSDSGELYWIIDAYTSSSYYPYSEPCSLSDTMTVNYIRNPVKVVINAYDGSVDYYQVEDEPIADTIGKIYPGLLKDISEMPEDLREMCIRDSPGAAAFSPSFRFSEAFGSEKIRRNEVGRYCFGNASVIPECGDFRYRSARL